MTDLRFIAILRPVLIGCFMSITSVCCSQTPWSGKAVYDVTIKHLPESQWDYLPVALTWETNGREWKLTETGTSFERVWLGAFDAEEYHILFHFLGHRVELVEACGKEDVSPCKGNADFGAGPCAWPTEFLPETCTLRDGPATYDIELTSTTRVEADDWDRKHFKMPSGYESMDRMSLSALLLSIHSDN